LYRNELLKQNEKHIFASKKGLRMETHEPEGFTEGDRILAPSSPFHEKGQRKEVSVTLHITVSVPLPYSNVDVAEQLKWSLIDDPYIRSVVVASNWKGETSQTPVAAPAYLGVLLRFMASEVIEGLLFRKPGDSGAGSAYPSLEQFEEIVAACAVDEATEETIRRRYNAILHRIRGDLLPVWRRAGGHFNTVLGMAVYSSGSFESSWMADEHLALEGAMRQAAQESSDVSVQSWYVASWMKRWRTRCGTASLPPGTTR